MQFILIDFKNLILLKQTSAFRYCNFIDKLFLSCQFLINALVIVGIELHQCIIILF